MKKLAKIKSDKYITVAMFEKNADFMAKSFNKVFNRFEQVDKKLEQHDKAFELVLKEMQTYRQESREIKMINGALNHTDVMQQKRIEGLEVRLERLEEKLK